MSPCARDRAIDQEDRHRVRRLGVEDDRPELLRHDLRPAGVNHQERLERLQEPHGARTPASGNGARGKSKSTLCSSSRMRRKRMRSTTGITFAGGSPDQLAMSANLAGPKPPR